MSYTYDIRVNVDTGQIKSGERAVQDFTRSADDAGKKVKDIEKNAKSSFDGVAKSAKAGAIALGAVAVAGAAAATALVLNAAKQADEMGKLAASLGVTTESLSALAFAADFSGSSIDGVSRALVRITDTQRKAADGNKVATETLKQFGITASDTADTAFVKIAERISQLEDGSAKTQLAIQAFGRSLGPDLIPLLNEGADGLGRFRSEADRLGLTISGKVAEDAAKFNDSVDLLGKTLQGIGLKVLPEVLPLMQELIDLLNDPKTAAAASEIAVGIGKIAINVAAAVKELPDFVQWLDYIGGGKVRMDNLEQINSELEQLRKLAINLQPGMSGAAGALAKFFAATGLSGDLETVIARIKELERARDRLLSGERLDRSGNILPSAGAIEADIANAGFGTGRPRVTVDDSEDTSFDTSTKNAERQLEVTRLTTVEMERLFGLQERTFDEFGNYLGNANGLLILQYQKQGLVNEQTERQLELSRQIPGIIANITDYQDSSARVVAAINRDLRVYNEYLSNATSLLGEQDESVKTLKATYDELLNIRNIEEARGEFEKIGLNMDSVANGFANTFVDGLETGKFAFKDFLADLARQMVKSAIVKLLTNLFASYFGGGTAVGGNPTVDAAFGFKPAAMGAAFSGPITPFAKGGIVGTPTKFFAAGGVGLMGEAGPEAIMPLKRGSDGKLGVAAQMSGGGSQYVINNYVTVEGGDDPNATAEATTKALNELMDRKIKQVLADQRRPGNSMNPTIEMY